MFDNLRAFIRHGKSASVPQKNEMYNKDAKGDIPITDAEAELMQASESTLAGNSTLPSDLEYSDYTSGSSQDEVERCKKHTPSDNLPLLEHKHQKHMKNEFDQNEDHAFQRAEYQHNNENYEYATRLVEEERKQRKRKYPNLEQYEMMEKLGDGAFSVVYKAVHRETGKHVAVKVLRKYQMDNAQKQAVLKEVIIMRQLKHPNIVNFIEFIESDPYYYIVQELVGGGEIFSAIVNYTYLSEDLSRHVIYQTALAVRYLHEEVGIVHRDIKPENLLFYPIEFKPSLNPIAKLRRSDDPKTKKDEGEFTPGVGGGTIGTVKLADFGLSKQIWSHNTKTPCGTVGYTAPEIVKDEKYSKEVDMWALGCVLYTVLCGFPPFYDERIETLTEKVASGEYTFLAPWWDEISAGAKYCVSRLLTVDPKHRYTIDELLQDPWLREAGRAYEKPNLSSRPYTSSQIGRLQLSIYKNELYSPAATAMREAFDISAAVHRAGEENALQNNIRNALPGMTEEEDEESIGIKSQVQKDTVDTEKSLFDLNLHGASILERRKNKALF
uniref:Protein kinase domain-containing protein n=1 Tax=Candidozyma auris TaxID=498019 RepID=A0A0L0NR43_CANAR